jgi:thioredoxin-like negative regulator of GroEL
MLKEADLAFRQSFAFCPYSPEALFRYVNLLIHPEVQRLDDALLLARTSQKLDPYNTSISDLVNHLEGLKNQRSSLNPTQLERELSQNPGDFQLALNLASEYFQLGQTNQAWQTLDRLLASSNASPALLRTLLQVYSNLSSQAKMEQVVNRLAAAFQGNPADPETGLALAEGYRAVQKPQLASQTLNQVLQNPSLDPGTILQVAQQFVAITNYPGLEASLDKLTKVAPQSPEAWYDLAALRSILGKPGEALQALRQALQLSAERRLRDPKARDLRAELQQDPRFAALRPLPEFKALVGRLSP